MPPWRLTLLMLAALLTPAVAAPQREEASVLNAALQAHAERLATLSTDQQALSLYRNSLARALALEDTVALLGSRPARGSHDALAPPPDLTTPALRLVQELIRWETALAWRAAAEAGDAARLDARRGRERSRQRWLAGGAPRQPMDRALRLAGVIAELDRDLQPGAPLGADEPALATALDEAHPAFASGPDSWLELAHREGAAGVRRRLQELRGGSAGHDASEAALAGYYRGRLRPVFLAQMTAASLLAEAHSARRAVELWHELRGWRERWSTARGRARLCGTWLWIVHNHQNHQDHKMVVTFPPPGEAPDDLPLPERIVVLGDTVYLRWEFPGGYQEDSLLFSAKDQRLEGTFSNSQGPHGSITGRRTAPCGRGGGRP